MEDTYIAHSYIAHSYIAHSYMVCAVYALTLGHNYIGHTYKGHNYTLQGPRSTGRGLYLKIMEEGHNNTAMAAIMLQGALE